VHIVESKEIYDVAIIGAGPAGISVAKAIKDSGYSMIIIDKESFPRKKPCAGVLPPRIYSELDIPPELQERELNGYRLYSPSGMVVESTFPKPGLIVDRTRFDEFLLKRLGQSVKRLQITKLIKHQNYIEVDGKNDSILAKIVVGADGINSIVRKESNISIGTVAMAAQYEVSLNQKEIDIKIGNWFEVYYTIPFGYGWLSPLRDKVKVGVGGISEELKKNPKQFLSKFMEHPEVKKKIENSEITNFELHRIPMSGPLNQLTAERTILVGDAGGFVYPGTGEGVYYAIKSGRLAGEVIIEALKKQRFDHHFLNQLYNEKLEVNGLFSLRDVDFVDRVLASADKAEKYLRKLKKIAIL
jgi:geranylgeranyl reductase family protein